MSTMYPSREMVCRVFPRPYQQREEYIKKEKKREGEKAEEKKADHFISEDAIDAILIE